MDPQLSKAEAPQTGPRKARSREARERQDGPRGGGNVLLDIAKQCHEQGEVTQRLKAQTESSSLLLIPPPFALPDAHPSALEDLSRVTPGGESAVRERDKPSKGKVMVQVSSPSIMQHERYEKEGCCTNHFGHCRTPTNILLKRGSALHGPTSLIPIGLMGH